MAKAFKIRLEIRGRTCEFEADSEAELNCFFAAEMFRLSVLTSPENIQDTADVAAKELIEQYCQQFGHLKNNRSRSPIACAGLELELAKCYRAKMTTSETVNWLKRERNFKTSITAVGRYWTRFAQLPVAVRIA